MVSILQGGPKVAAELTTIGRRMRIGIDLGGTKIEAIALDPDGSSLARRRIATPRGDYDSTIKAIASLVTGLEEEFDRRGSVGIGIPGAISRVSGRVKNANSTWIIGKPLDRDLGRLRFFRSRRSRVGRRGRRGRRVAGGRRCGADGRTARRPGDVPGEDEHRLRIRLV